jgi:hypothetical protein
VSRAIIPSKNAANSGDLTTIQVRARITRTCDPLTPSPLGTSGQYPRQDLIPGNMDDGFHDRDDESVLSVRPPRPVATHATERPRQWGVLIP